MEKFILKSRIVVLDDSQVNIILYPDHSYLFDKVEVGEVTNVRSDMDSQIADLIIFYTPILFNLVQEMENIPQYIKDNIEL